MRKSRPSVTAEQALNSLLIENEIEQDRAYEILGETIMRIHNENIPTLILFKEVEKLARFLEIDFIDGIEDERIKPIAEEMLALVRRRNEKEVASERYFPKKL